MRYASTVAAKKSSRGASPPRTRRASTTHRSTSSHGVDAALSPLAFVAADVSFGEGARTTLRVPAAVADAAALLADELGTTKNDAIVRLALAGARIVDRARAIAATRDARWQALVAHEHRADALPDAEAMRAAAFALREDAAD